MANLVYDASPTLARFMKSEAFGRIAAGPIGSGKTTADIMELLRRSIAQSKAQDGRRYTRFAIVRQTLKQLKDTVLKDCETQLQGLGEWKVSENTFPLKLDRFRVDVYPFRECGRSGPTAVDAVDGGVAFRMHRNELGCGWACEWTVRAIPIGRAWIPDVARLDRRHEYAYGNDAVAHIHGELASGLAEVCAALRALARGREPELAPADRGNEKTSNR